MPSIGIVTDSNSQLTDAIRDRFQVEVVPLTVTIDGADRLEGVDLDADAFYARFAGGASPEIATSQPAPGRFAAAYELLARRGCEAIVSIHLAEAMSGTIGSASVAARGAPVPVHVIDTGTASFGVAVCVWAAGVVLGRGGDADDVQRRIERLVPDIGTAFMVGVPLLTERGGRAHDVELGGGDIPVLAMSGGALEVLERVSTIEDTVDVMSTYAAGWGDDVTVAIGTSDESSRPVAKRLSDALAGLEQVAQLVSYRIGPSVGAHTGPGTFGLFVWPTIH